MLSARVTGVVLVVVSAASFGALGVLARVAYDNGAQPVGVLLCRFSLAAACFVVLARVTGRWRLTRRAVPGLLAMGVCYLLQSLCYFSAINHAPPGLVALLLYTYPVLVVILAVSVFGVRLSRRAAAACVVAVVGTALIVGPSAQTGEPVGVVLGLAAAVIYAVYILIGSRVLLHVDAIPASAVIMSTAALGYVVVFALSPHRPRFPDTGTGWAAVITLALLCTVVAVVTFLAGLARVGPADASTLSTVEPAVSVVLSAMVTGEAITGWTVSGALLIIGSVVTLSRTAGSGHTVTPVS